MKVARAYEEYLQKEGYRPKIDDDGRVEFKAEGGFFMILPDEGDPTYFQLIYPAFWTLEDDAQRARAYSVAHDAANSIKAGKFLIQGDRVHSVVECLMPELESFPRIIERAVHICRGAAQKFAELMRATPPVVDSI